mmetsp:Transcript_8327/g.12535  ORF Transcript_8327/g.12535 Transcript_8327/m.12535 type:complete len:82 (+) Transcript_8327:142-387(+)
MQCSAVQHKGSLAERERKVLLDCITSTEFLLYCRHFSMRLSKLPKMCDEIRMHHLNEISMHPTHFKISKNFHLTSFTPSNH